MKRLSLLVAAAAIVGFSGAASAAQPEDPGCAAEVIYEEIGKAIAESEPGASEWGTGTADDGAENSVRNQRLKERCGGIPDQGAPEPD